MIEDKYRELQVNKRYCMDIGRICGHRCKFCVSANTQITMSDGTKKTIVELKIGDLIVAFDEQTKEFATTEVCEVMERETDEDEQIYDLKTKNEHLVITGKHPVFSNGKWINAEELQLDSQLLINNENQKLFENLESKEEIE